MLRRALIRFWLPAALIWLFVSSALYYLGFQEALFALPAGAEARVACADVPACVRRLAVAYLAEAALAGLGVPLALLGLGALALWALDGFPLRPRR